MFSVFEAMFLRPLPFKDGKRLVSIAGQHPETRRRVALSLEDLRELTPAVQSVETIAAYSGRASTLTDGGEPERIATQLVTANLFPTAGGVTPRRGQGFRAGDEQPAAAGVALISDSLWHRRYQADPNAVGRVIRLDGVPYTVIGVMPPAFQFPRRSELWIPLAPALGGSGAPSRSVSIIGRLAPDATIERANAELGGAGACPSAIARSARRLGAAVCQHRRRRRGTDRSPARSWARRRCC